MNNIRSNIFFGSIFIIFSFFSCYKIRFSPDDNGLIFFLFILIVCSSSDIGGYFCGKFFGGPKLTSISPNKTYAGVFGSYLFSFVTIYFFIKFVNFYEISNNLLNFNDLIIFIVLLSTISQLGDIIVSAFKRKNNVKDTGSIIPGHGGMLDRIDGMLFAYPFAFLFNLF